MSSSDGSVDNRFSLELEDDAAHVSWGGSWRMPTAEEQKELCNNCKWTWGSMNGVAGYIVVSEINGNSIFLPAAGQRGTSTPNYGKNGYYWSGSLYTINSNDANFIIFSSKIVDRGGDYRNLGKSIRPVCPRH